MMLQQLAPKLDHTSQAFFRFRPVAAFLCMLFRRSAFGVPNGTFIRQRLILAWRGGPSPTGWLSARNGCTRIAFATAQP